jgi:hypothetical protein
MCHYIFYIYSCDEGMLLKDYMDRACSTRGEKTTAYMISVVNPEGKRPLGRPRRGWENSIKMYLREIRWDGRDWNSVAQDRGHWPVIGNTVMNNWLSKNIRKYLSS